MAKQEGLKFSGTVIEVLPSATFRVKIDGIASPILAYISGKMRVNSINVLLGDTVEVEMSPYDLTRGRIIFRKA